MFRTNCHERLLRDEARWKTELTSNIAEDTIFDESAPVLAEYQLPGQPSQVEVTEDTEKTYEQNVEEAVMSFAGGEGWYWNTNEQFADEDTVWHNMPQDDPSASKSSSNEINQSVMGFGGVKAK